MTRMPNPPKFREAVRQADALFALGYPPLGARLVGRRIEDGEVVYGLAYRAWRLVVRLHRRRRAHGDTEVVFSCRMVRSSFVDSFRNALPWTDDGSSVIEPVLIGSRDFEGVVECMAEAYHRIIHRGDVQRSIRRDPTWPISA